MSKMGINYEGCPESVQGPLERYIEDRIPTGGFLMAVLSNDLRGSLSRADLHNRNNIFQIVSWLYNNAPSDCWGSADKVSAWLTETISRVPEDQL